MKKLIFRYFLMLNIMFLGCSWLVYGMIREDIDFQRALQESRKAYAREQAQKRREAALMLKLKKESEALERLRSEKYRLAEEAELQKALKLSQQEFEQEKAKRALQELEVEKIKEQQMVEVEPKSTKEADRVPQWLAKLGANAIVIVNNVNLSIVSMELAEADGTIRKGIARSKVGALWDIPVKMENKPFIFSIISKGKRYRWKILSFEIYNLELGLIEKNTQEGPQIMLEQLEESGAMPEYPKGFMDWVVIPLFDVQSIK